MKHKAFYNGKKVKVVEMPDGECEGYLDDYNIPRKPTALAVG